MKGQNLKTFELKLNRGLKVLPHNPMQVYRRRTKSTQNTLSTFCVNKFNKNYVNQIEKGFAQSDYTRGLQNPFLQGRQNVQKLYDPSTAVKINS